jgi:hypothetical protein
MQDGRERAARALRRGRARPWLGVGAALMLGCAAAACATGSSVTGSLAPDRKVTVAFESIDGPPPAVFQNLVQKLTDAAQAQRIPMVTHEGPADYRIRGYLAASVAGGQTAIAWVWDVYDAEGRRALRIEGEVPTGDGGHEPWSSADDVTLQRVAQAGMERLGAFLRAPAEAPGPAIASAEAAAAGAAQANASADVGARASVSLPRRRPPAAGGRGADVVALAMPPR